MPRKSKSSKSTKKRKSSKTPNVSSSKDVSVSEINAIAKQSPDEDARASIQTENCDLKTSEEYESEVYVFYDSSLELSKIPSTPTDFKIPSPSAFISCFEKSKSVDLIESSKWIELPIRSESVIPIMRPELNESTMSSRSVKSKARSKSADQRIRFKSIVPVLRSVISEPILKSELTDWTLEFLYTQLMRKRRHNFVHLIETSADIINYMEYLGTFRNTEDDRNCIVNNRWKENDSSDWFDLLNLWDKVQDDIRTFMDVLECSYENFDEDVEISITMYEFKGFTRDLGNIFNSIGLLLKRCTNCYHKYSRFCATIKEFTFLKNVSNFRRNIACFHKKIKVELNKFEILRDLTHYDKYDSLL